MGSAGSSRFSDYSNAPKKPIPPSGGRRGASGGSSGSDPCDQAFSADLEDVGHSEYFQNHGGVPAKGVTVSIELRARVCAVSAKGEVIGNLPTKHNGLAQCIKAGWKYRGVVQLSSLKPIPKVAIDGAPV
jgi:hypothetical protein